MQSVIEEKESRLVEVLISSVRPGQLLSGKILAMGVLGLFQIAVWIGISLALMMLQRDQVAAVVPFLTSLRIPLDALPILAIYFVLGYLIFAAEFGAIGAISNSLQEGPQFSIIFVLPALAPLFFLTAFVADPNGGLATFLSIFPFTSPMSMTMRSVITAVPAWQVVLSIALLAVTVWATFWIAGRLFRVQTLLAGKAPKVYELPRLIFGKS
jgi:ABC-2 type transport system permease protein